MNNNFYHINKVEISKLWGKVDIDWTLHPDVNILAGINGSGKTTILDSICALLVIGPLPPEHPYVERVNITFENQKNIFYERLQGTDTVKNLERKAKKDGRFKAVIEGLKRDVGSEYNSINSIQFDAGFTSFDNLNISLEELQTVLTIDVVSTFDNPLKQSESIRKLSNEEIRTELDWEIYQLQKQYLDYQLNISKKKDEIIDNSNDVKNEIAILKRPQSRFLEILDSLYGETGKKVDQEKNEISFLLGDKEITPYQLSSGEKQLLIILLTVLVQDNKQSILFMDEPELSLHLEWQKKLIAFIRELNPNLQLIIATHSPGMIMDGWLDKVFEMNDIIVS